MNKASDSRDGEVSPRSVGLGAVPEPVIPEHALKAALVIGAVLAAFVFWRLLKPRERGGATFADEIFEEWKAVE